MANINTYLNQNISSSSLSDFVNAKVEGLAKTNDKEVIGIAGFTAYAAVSVQRKLSSESPDVTIENGSTIADTIFLRPIEILITGEVADINIPIDTNDNVLEQASSVVGVISQYIPNRSLTQINKVEALNDSVINALKGIDQFFDSTDRLLNIFGNKSGSKSNQEQFIDVMDKLHFSKSVTRLETPFRVYENIRITEFTSTQDNRSKAVTFTITAKQVRLADLAFISDPVPQNINPSTGTDGQTQGESDKGITDGDPVNPDIQATVRGLF